MKRAKRLLTAAAAVLCTPASAADLPPEDQLRQMVEGHTAQPPQRCVRTDHVRRLKIIDGTALVFTAGKMLYVNRPINAAALRHNLIPAFEPDAGRLCQGAQVSLHASDSMWNTGAVRLQDWVPYRKNGKD